VNAAWLRHEYIVKQRTMEDIALETGISPYILRAKARELGFRKRLPSPFIPTEWIYQEHVVNQRSIAEMACEIGIDSQILRKRAHKFGIPVHRPRGRRRKPSPGTSSNRRT